MGGKGSLTHIRSYRKEDMNYGSNSKERISGGHLGSLPTRGAALRNASVMERARPRAQQYSKMRRCRNLPGAAGVRTLLRPGTGALRHSPALTDRLLRKNGGVDKRGGLT